MTNLAKDRNTDLQPSTEVQPLLGGFGLAANAKTFKGTLFILDANGRPTDPGAVASIVAGIHRLTLDATGLANDAIKAEGYTGPVKLDLHGVNPPTAADTLKFAYASDNHTISRLASDGSLAGIILQVEADGVWIWVGPAASSPSLNPGLNAGTNGIVAFATGGQAGAVQLIAGANRIATVGSAADSVKLPIGVAGMTVAVRNAAGVNSANVFPGVGDAINELGANAAFALAAGKSATFYCVAATQWIAVLSA